MVVFSFGEPFPLHHKANGTEYCRADFNDSFFDICYYFPDVDERHINTWGTAPFKYGVFEAHHIPFFLVAFEIDGKPWYFDLFLNVHHILGGDAAIWLKSEGRIIRLYLIEGNTNHLVGMRMISINENAANYIREICEEQYQTYQNIQAVDVKIDKIIDSISTAEMVQRTKMLKTP
jgi:hypothetical protein